MNILIVIFSALVALEFLFIMYLETFATTSSRTAETFSMSKDALKKDEVNLLLKNQGIYNGLIGVGILYLLIFTQNYSNTLFAIMLYIVLVALYGSFSSGNKSIFFKQGTLAVIVLVLLLAQMILG
jgi:Predicted membrane protein